MKNTASSKNNARKATALQKTLGSIYGSILRPHSYQAWLAIDLVNRRLVGQMYGSFALNSADEAALNRLGQSGFKISAGFGTNIASGNGRLRLDSTIAPYARQNSANVYYSKIDPKAHVFVGFEYDAADETDLNAVTGKFARAGFDVHRTSSSRETPQRDKEILRQGERQKVARFIADMRGLAKKVLQISVQGYTRGATFIVKIKGRPDARYLFQYRESAQAALNFARRLGIAFVGNPASVTNVQSFNDIKSLKGYIAPSTRGAIQNLQDEAGLLLVTWQRLRGLYDSFVEDMTAESAFGTLYSAARAIRDGSAEMLVYASKRPREYLTAAANRLSMVQVSRIARDGRIVIEAMRKSPNRQLQNSVGMMQERINAVRGHMQALLRALASEEFSRGKETPGVLSLSSVPKKGSGSSDAIHQLQIRRGNVSLDAARLRDKVERAASSLAKWAMREGRSDNPSLNDSQVSALLQIAKAGKDVANVELFRLSPVPLGAESIQQFVYNANSMIREAQAGSAKLTAVLSKAGLIPPSLWNASGAAMAHNAIVFVASKMAYMVRDLKAILHRANELAASAGEMSPGVLSLSAKAPNRPSNNTATVLQSALRTLADRLRTLNSEARTLPKNLPKAVATPLAKAMRLAANAEPSIVEAQTAISSGNWKQAEAALREVWRSSGQADNMTRGIRPPSDDPNPIFTNNMLRLYGGKILFVRQTASQILNNWSRYASPMSRYSSGRETPGVLSVNTRASRKAVDVEAYADSIVSGLRGLVSKWLSIRGEASDILQYKVGMSWFQEAPMQMQAALNFLKHRQYREAEKALFRAQSPIGYIGEDLIKLRAKNPRAGALGAMVEAMDAKIGGYRTALRTLIANAEPDRMAAYSRVIDDVIRRLMARGEVIFRHKFGNMVLERQPNGTIALSPYGASGQRPIMTFGSSRRAKDWLVKENVGGWRDD